MRCISVPVSLDVMNRLEYDKCIGGDLIDCYLDNNEYHILQNANIFHSINNLLDINIDDYEDERIIGIENLCKAQSVIKNSLSYDSSNRLLKLLLSQVEKAISFNTGVFFYF